jgi:aminoglycoside 6-adenylyltransferase
MKRSAKEIIELILNIAKKDNRIQGVIMNGSRANPNIKQDNFQDFDIVFVVNKLSSFRNDKNCTEHFGELRIMQKPNEMVIPAPVTSDVPTFLMLFKYDRLFKKLCFQLFEVKNIVEVPF